MHHHGNFKHGHSLSSGNGEADQRSREYRSWEAMKTRCLNPRSKDFPRYGGAGVTIYPPWVESFSEFLRYMGPRPEGTTLDRWPNNRGNYEPGNVRWTTPKEQLRNVKVNVMLTLRGETKCLAEWCEQFGLRYHLVYGRLQKGWPLEKALSPHRPRLTKKDAREIRVKVRAGMSWEVAANCYGVSRATISAIVARRANWA